jgi:hypothetical protein
LFICAFWALYSQEATAGFGYKFVPFCHAFSPPC